MLILSRKMGQRVMIDDNIIITVIEIDKKWNQIKLGFEAPENIKIVREEILGLYVPKYLSEDDLKCQLLNNTK